MLGFPYTYGDAGPNQDEKFLIFSLNRVSENSKLNLTKASSLPILPMVYEQTNINLGDTFSYQFCDQISQLCGSFHTIPQTETIVLDYNGFCKLVSQSDMIISTVASDLGITKISAMEQAQNFFKDKNVIVQAGGIQGAVYRAGSYLQSAGSAGLVAHTLGIAKLAGISGLQMLKAQPSLLVAIPTTGAMFFYGCGAIAGNTSIGKALITTGDALALPMKTVEMMWNSYGNPVIHKVFGIPVILNLTQTFKTGPGYTVNEIKDYIIKNENNSSLVKWLKEGIGFFLRK